MRKKEFNDLVRFIKRGDHWQKRCLIALSLITQDPLPEEAKVEWAAQYEWINDWIAKRGSSHEK